MARQWTKAQERAITIRDKTLLVSAAAGSGKTATLTERIIRRITDSSSPADISQMLIVTFTRAAASELKAKIFTALGDAVASDPSNKHLASQLVKLGSAKICTIDSFYFDLIKSNLSALGISSTRRIADDAEYRLLAEEAMEKAIDHFYEIEPRFPSFVECFTGIRNQSALPAVLLDIHAKLGALPDGIEFINTCAERTYAAEELDFFASSYGKTLQTNSRDIFTHYLPILEEANQYIMTDPAFIKSYGAPFTRDLDLCRELAQAVEDSNSGYARIYSLLSLYSPLPLTRISGGKANEETAMYKELRSGFTSKMKELKTKAFSKAPSTISRAMSETAVYLHILYRLLEDFERLSGEEKDKLGILTFADIRRLTLKLLVKEDKTPTDIALQYTEQYSDIFIDEYQDVDEVQDLIFSSISKKGNRFMVGDIKQSIYEFRGADPSLFARYRKSFPMHDSPEGEKSSSVSIFMSNNFRCDKNIIDFTNLVCSTIFSRASESIGYTSDDDLRYSKQYDNTEYISPKVKIALVRSPSRAEKLMDENYAKNATHDYEAEYIANEIDWLLHNGKKADGSPILPCDIAVLFRTKAVTSAISEALGRHGILSTNADADKYFESPDVLMVLCLLNVIDNPERDIYLAGTLRSSMFGFELDDLIKIKKPYGEAISLYGALCRYGEENDNRLAKRCCEFKDTITLWQSEAASLSIDRFLLMLFDSERFLATGIVAHANTDGEGGNLLLLYEYARKFENGSFKGLYQFIEYINTLIEKGQTLSLNESHNAANRVTLMTMHKSKGLEFPVCFIANAGGSLTPKDTKESLVFNKNCGIAMKLSDSTGLARINTPLREAVISEIAARQAEEEMRILYVALTRARERLYITAESTKDPQSIIDASLQAATRCDKYTIISDCNSYLDWILLSCTQDENPTYEFELVALKPIEQPKKLLPDTSSECTFEADSKLLERINESFDFEYHYKELFGVPSKISVSRLYPDVLDENSESLELFTDPKPADIPPFFSGIQKATSAAERGTATHLFLQFCNLEYARTHGAAEELARLCHKGFLPPNAEELIYLDELEGFIQGELADKMILAKKVIREQRFNIKLSPKNFSKNEKLLEAMQNEELAVQGVIDLITINEDGSVELYDYKTDRLTKEELKDPKLAKKTMQERHGLQLSYYAKAAELLFGVPCRRVAVFSTHSSTLYDIDVNDTEANIF